MQQLTASLVFAICAGFAGAAHADMPVAEDGRLVDASGATLYTYDKDSAGISTCNAKCAEFWPPALADDNETPTGEWSLIDREDGTRQWAYKGMPLYRFAKDEKPGDINGDGVREVWHTAKP